jgi:CheY-like chemotaxis protein
MTERTRVLIIDDDEDIVKLAKIMIGYMGYEVTATTDNLSVFDLLEEEHYILLLLDIQMPNMDGYEICRKVRDSPHRDIKIVLFTASADEDVISKGKAAGADEVLSKPFSIQQIKDTVRKVIEDDRVPLRSGDEFAKVYAP